MAALAVAALLVPGCGREPMTRRRPYREIAGTLELGPSGLTGAPLCTQVELTGGRHGGTRYEVELDLTRMRGPARPVFYTVEVVAGGRTYRGYVTTQRPVRGPAGSVLPAEKFGELRVAAVAPEDRAGVQQVEVPLSGCALTVEEPSADERAAGGRVLPEAGDEAVVVDPDGVLRPMGRR